MECLASFMLHPQGYLYLHDSRVLFLSHPKGCIHLNDSVNVFFLSYYQGCMHGAPGHVILVFWPKHPQLNIFVLDDNCGGLRAPHNNSAGPQTYHTANVHTRMDINCLKHGCCLFDFVCTWRYNWVIKWTFHSKNIYLPFIKVIIDFTSCSNDKQGFYYWTLSPAH